MKKIFDISPLISSRTGVFPGDVAFQRNVSLEIDKGHSIGLSSVTSTLHLGAHADGPIHYVSGGSGIHERSLDYYLGPCLVLHASAPRGARISREHLGSAWQANATWPAQRILVRTQSFPNPDKWNSDFNSFDPSLIELWAQAGVVTIGIDTPSIDPETSKDLPSHQAVAKNDLAILEGIVLDAVPEGVYSLIALPLKIEGADASPVRAILIDDQGRLLE